MTRLQADHIIVIGAGAAGLMAARELGRAGKRVTILEARDRCGGRIDPLPMADFGYRAEGGAEFVHGEAPVTRAVLREAGLSLVPLQGTRWTAREGTLSRDDAHNPHAGRLHRVLAELKADLPIAEFLTQNFSGPEYGQLRHSILRMVEGYDAADPARASTFALRDEWMNGERGPQTRIVGGYGALIDFLAAECVGHGVRIHFGAAVSAIEPAGKAAAVVCANGDRHIGDVTILTVALPLLQDIELPSAARQAAAAAGDIGFGNVIKILLRFKDRCWARITGNKLTDLSFLVSDQTVPVWWTQHPSAHAVLTGWFAGPRTEGLASLDEKAIVKLGTNSLAAIFGLSLPQLQQEVVAARAINWGNDPFARGAYSYATVKTRAAQSTLAAADGAVLFSGEALYRGHDMGTVEAALASGLETARTLLGAGAR
jgi:monoamine oxidase